MIASRAVIAPTALMYAAYDTMRAQSFLLALSMNCCAASFAGCACASTGSAEPAARYFIYRLRLRQQDTLCVLGFSRYARKTEHKKLKSTASSGAAPPPPRAPLDVIVIRCYYQKNIFLKVMITP